MLLFGGTAADKGKSTAVKDVARHRKSILTLD